MFVSASDFQRQPYILANLDKGSANVFPDFVSYNEDKYLRELLGNTFWDTLVEAFPSIPAVYSLTTAYVIGNQVVYVVKNIAEVYECIVNSPAGTLPTDATKWTKQPANRWARLVYGDMYQYYTRSQRWYGMKRLVVPLIYALKTTYEYDNQGSNGISVANKENATVVSPAVRIARAMNEYADLAAGDWPNVVDWSSVLWPELENSLFGYLYLGSSTWDDLVVAEPGGDFKAYLVYSFCYPGHTNVFGI